MSESSSGEILAAVSSPDYDPELFTGLILERTWQDILNNPDKPLLNRYLQGLYPPGSIVKMITQAALMEIVDFNPNTTYICDGSYQFGDRLFGCWWHEGHGKKTCLQLCWFHVMYISTKLSNYSNLIN